MADLRKETDGPSPLSAEGYDESLLPDFDRQFISEVDLAAFAAVLSAPDPSPSTDDLLGSYAGLTSPTSRTSIDSLKSSDKLNKLSGSSQQSLFITAQNDWAPVHKRVKTRRKGEKRKRKQPRRSRDETREGYLYTLLKWPMLLIVSAWVAGLGISYLWTRLYIWLYEHFVAWRGKRAALRKKLQGTTNYKDWVGAAKELDRWAGNEEWKEEDEYAYYDSKTVKRVLEQIRKARRKAEEEEKSGHIYEGAAKRSIVELKGLIEACVKNNFVGVENARLYSQTYYGTKNLVQEFIDEGENIPTSFEDAITDTL